MPPSSSSPALSRPGPGTSRAGLQVVGLLLFLFIPLVLFLFVRHPAPIGLSLAAGVALIAGHRRLARPYMERALPHKCLWCNRVLPESLDASSRTLDLRTGGEVRPARCCTRHRDLAGRFFALLSFARWPLRAGIFLPLAVLLAALAAAAFGWDRYLPAATALFQLVVGFTVSLAAFAYRAMPLPDPRAPLPVPFPAHNFFLLGVRTLLWIFRLVGLWWIVQGWRGLAAIWHPG